MKKNGYNILTTPYAERMDKDTPWAEYPRPSMVRSSYMTLNGRWEFALGDKEYPTVYDKSILVPFPPESALSGLEMTIPRGRVMFYRRSFSIPEGFNRGRVLLNFGACDAVCEVRINGKTVASHEGGYLPFSADISDYLRDGDNLLEVKARDDISTLYPYGKQTHKRGGMWYTPVSGIWQSVWLESVPRVYVEKLKIATTDESVHIEVIGGADEKRLLLDDGEIIEWRGTCVDFCPKTIVKWSPENPKLYRFRLECGEDTVDSYFALRRIDCRVCDGVGRICLNGEPYLFNGLLDQGYYPDGLFLPATSEGYLEDILTAKKMGFNMLRKHIKVEPDVFYYLCDLHGMAVFQDMVNNSGYSFILDTALPTVGLKSLPDNLRHRDPAKREFFIRHSLETVEHLYSHPSVLYYTVFNEGWGQFSADKVYRIIKDADPTRVIDATSGWFTRHDSDVDSRHVYFKAVKLGKLSERPLVISEFGGYSHRVDGHLYGDDNYGYKLFEDEEKFAEAFEKLYSEEIAPLIPLGVSALVYTQVSDIEDETNGILTYDRRHLKLDPDRIKPIMERLAKSIRQRG